MKIDKNGVFFFTLVKAKAKVSKLLLPMWEQ